MANTFTLKLEKQSFELTEGQSPRGLRIGQKRPNLIELKIEKLMNKKELATHIDYLVNLHRAMQ